MENMNKEPQKIADEIEETVAVVNGHVVRAKWIVATVKPLMYGLQVLGYFAVWGIALYGGTWIVVLALRHAKVLH